MTQVMMADGGKNHAFSLLFPPPSPRAAPDEVIQKTEHAQRGGRASCSSSPPLFPPLPLLLAHQERQIEEVRIGSAAFFSFISSPSDQPFSAETFDPFPSDRPDWRG